MSSLLKLNALALGLVCSLFGAENSNWSSNAHGRSLVLRGGHEARVGFTQFTTTGINFTNRLDEWSSAANRTLQNGSGVAIGDYDNDGMADIFFCSLTGTNALYRNLGGWTFENSTAQAGINPQNHVCGGAVFADIDGDGWLDLLISTLGHGVICFHNAHGHFQDYTAEAGTRTSFGSTTLALADVNGDGTLDLYVANYRTNHVRDQVRIPVQVVNGKPVVPPSLKDRLFFSEGRLMEFGEPDILYLNDGKGRFRPVSWTGGSFADEEGEKVQEPPRDWGLSAAFRDINDDGFPDIYVCNDYWSPDRLWLGDGKGHFRAIPRLAVRQTSENSMGVDFADVDRDGHTDFFVVDMLSRDSRARKRQLLAQTYTGARVGEILSRPQIMRNSLQHNRGDGTFEELADFSGLAASDWSWQPVFVDVDLDGYEDLIIPAGHTRDIQDLDATEKIQSLQHPWDQRRDLDELQREFTRERMLHSRFYPELPLPILAFRNLGNLHFEDVTSRWGTDSLGIHQGIAFGDLDGDGDLDFVVNNLNGPAGIYRNEGNAPRVAVRLRGQPPNTQGIGARITLRSEGLVQTQEVISGGRYLSGDDPLRVFAISEKATDAEIQVTWRTGKKAVIKPVPPNSLHEIYETGLTARALAP